MLIIRHAESLYNVHLTADMDSDLTNHGEFQAEIISNYIKPFDLLGYSGFTSPMLRCLKTARYIHRKTDIKFKVCPELCEVSWCFPETGLPIRVMAEPFWEMDWTGVKDEETLNLPKETDSMFLEKMAQFFATIPEKSIIVTHGTCVMTLVELARNTKLEKVPDWDGSIRNASLTEIVKGVPTCSSVKNASLTEIANGVPQHIGKVVY
mgnify:CR=1 FL=1